MLSRIAHLTILSALPLLLCACSDSSESSQSASSESAAQPGSGTAESGQPSWALSQEEQQKRAAAELSATGQSTTKATAASNQEDLEFERVWSALEAKEQSHLIFVSASEYGLQQLDAFLEKYPESRHREKALYLAAIARWSSYNWAEGAGRYEAYLAEFPDRQRSLLARMRHAQCLIKSDNPEIALKVLDEYKPYNLAHQRELVRAEALASMGKVEEAKSLLRAWLVSPQTQQQQERTKFEARKLLERIESLNIQAPNFNTYAYNTGEQISMDGFRGNVLLVDFWKSTCNPCMSELPLISDLYDMYHADGFDVLAVNMDTDVNGMELAMEIIGADWPVHYDGLAFDGELAQLFGVNRCPHTVLIDRNGIIRAVDIRFDTLARLVPQLLSEPVSN